MPKYCAHKLQPRFYSSSGTHMICVAGSPDKQRICYSQGYGNTWYSARYLTDDVLRSIGYRRIPASRNWAVPWHTLKEALGA